VFSSAYFAAVNFQLQFSFSFLNFRFEAWHRLPYLLDGLLRVQGANMLFISNIRFSDVSSLKILCQI